MRTISTLLLMRTAVPEGALTTLNPLHIGAFRAAGDPILKL